MLNIPTLLRRLPRPIKQAVKAVRRPFGIMAMSIGRVRSLSPLSTNWGEDRGTPIDRYYIEGYLAKNASGVKGRVLEVQEDDYSRRFGGSRVSHQDVLSLHASNARATIVGDLANPETLPAGQFDCIILTQTLHLVYDMPSAMANVHRALKPGGIALITVPGITPLDRYDFLDNWYWSLTGPALQRLLLGAFPPENITVETFGNLYAATAFLHAAAVEEVNKRKLDKFDRAYPVTIAARAIA